MQSAPSRFRKDSVPPPLPAYIGEGAYTRKRALTKETFFLKLTCLIGQPSMRTLAKISGEKYGLDAERWTQFLAYRRGESSKPRELSITERAPKLDTAIFK